MNSSTTLQSSIPQVKAPKRRDVHLGDRLFSWILKAASLLIVAVLLVLMGQLWKEASPAAHKFGFGFLSGQDWNPVTEKFGALPFLYGTVVSSLLALLIACPISIGVALFLTEIAPRRMADAIGTLVEMLAAIPSVVYGLWGIFVLAPFLRSPVETWLGSHLGFLPIFKGAPYGIGMLAAGVILAIMIIPTISSLSREVFRAVPINQREAALALGATRWEMIRISVFQSSYSGLMGAVILGLGRALGETMAVTMLIGNRPQISLSLFSPSQTMASVIANEYAEATSDVHLSALALVGIVLFGVSFAINGLARALIWRLKRQSGGMR